MALFLKYAKKQYRIASYKDLGDYCNLGATAIKNAINALHEVDEVEEGEILARFTWTKPTRKYPSKPSFCTVEIGDPNFSEQYVITSDGYQVKRSTLRRLPRNILAEDILSRRNIPRA